MTTPEMETGQGHIDKLLERYLHLLNEYTTLRADLTNLQTAMYQNIARANYSAERGMRVGQDFYDERMQATRRISITSDDKGLPIFRVLDKEDDEEDSVAVTAADAEVKSSSSDSDANVAESENHREGDTMDDDDADKNREPSDTTESAIRNQKSTKQQAQKKNRDPLKWYGLITPTQLRQAQSQSIRAVEKLVPRLVSINAEMAEVEIEVRRARKKRAKAEAAAAKSHGLEGERVTGGASRDIVA